MNGEGAVTNFKTNIKNDVVEVLKTILLLDKSFGMKTLMRVLKGDEESEWLKPEHRQLETFGALSETSWDHLKNVLYLMVDMEFIQPGTNGVLKIAVKGQAFIDKPSDLEVLKRNLRTGKYESLLLQKLKVMRKALAEEVGKPPFQILSNFTIELIARKMPANLDELRAISGMGAFKAEKHGDEILPMVARIIESKRLEAEEKLQKVVKTPTYQETKELFQKGKTVTEIAKAKKVSEKTVQSYLEKLHLCGEIDMKPWIEENLDSKKLYKGAEYFKQVDNPKMKEAYEVLGLDYEELRLCKLYVSDHSSRYEVVKV